MGDGWYYDLGRWLLVLRREEEGAGCWSCGHRSAGGGADAQRSALGLSACGRREEGEPRSVEGSDMPVGRSTDGLLMSADYCGGKGEEGGRLRSAPRWRGILHGYALAGPTLKAQERPIDG
jgi:hypothetical protein